MASRNRVAECQAIAAGTARIGRRSTVVQCQRRRPTRGVDRHSLTESDSQCDNFARVQVAEIRLYKSENVKKGRAARSLYASLKAEIDFARETYRNDYIAASDTMMDYLHLALLRTLANDDVELPGSDYPGALV